MATNLDKLFKTSDKMEQEGIWFDISETTSFRIKRFGGMNAPRVKELLNKLYKPYARMIENGTMDPKKETEIGVRVFVMSSVVDWKGVEIDGADSPFSVEAAVSLFLRLPDLYQALFNHASDYNNFKEDLGN